MMGAKEGVFMRASEKRAEAVRLMTSRLKKNRYTQGNDRNCFWGKPEGREPGYSDCSSSVRAVLLRAAGVDIGSNTSAQIGNRARGLLVEDNRDGSRTYPTPAKIQPGDCIYYKGNSAHIWRAGHVEMAMSKTQCAGHGGGTGPTLKNIKSYSRGRTGPKKYLCVIRWILDDKTPEPDAGALRVRCTCLNLRAGPGTGYGIERVAKEGERLTPVAFEGWTPIDEGDHVLWASRKYLENA